MFTIYFYNIPVYRLAREQYYSEREKYVNDFIYPEGSPHNDMRRGNVAADSHYYSAVQDSLEKSYGGCWEFNEIIGYIMLHFLGSQIRGEYFSVSKKRIVRTRTKIFEFQTWKLAPEIDLPRPITNKGVYEAVLQYLVDCQKELPRRYIDTVAFEAIGRYVDWCSLIKGEKL